MSTRFQPAFFSSGITKAFRRVNLVCWAILLGQSTYAALLIEEGFGYPTNTALGANAPWTGSGTSTGLRIVSGNLSLTNLQAAVTNGNRLRIGGGTGGQGRRTFSPTPILNQATNAIYVSFLLNCSVLPTNSSPFIAALLSGSAGSPNQPDDPLDLYFTNAPNGFKFVISHNGNDPLTGPDILTRNATHLIVLKYQFGGPGRCSLYIDPPTGGTNEPPYNLITINEGVDTADLQAIVFAAPGTASEGIWQIDTLRIGTSWSDVTPLPTPVSVAGPADQAVCLGSPAVFSITNSGIPPFVYQWRTNGSAIPGATHSSYTNQSPVASDASRTYDVVIQDAFGSITSRVAKLWVSQVAAAIAVPPTNQIIWPGVSNATFMVVASGDAPLTYQWCVNGTPISGETNSIYNLNNPGSADALKTFQVIVANPCGAVTSSPPVTVLFPHPFYLCDSLPGFFSGMNLFTTLPSGQGFFCWSSSDPGQPIPNWTLEGPMFESPLNDGSGNSSYSINVNPAVSPVYYLVGSSISPPYVQPVPVHWITTDANGFYSYYFASYGVDANNVLMLPTPPAITQQPLAQTVLAGKTVTYSVTTSGTEPLAYQWFFNTNSPLTSATNSVLTLFNITLSNAGTYSVVVTNPYGSVTSSVAGLAVVSPPVLSLQTVSTGLQLTGHGVPGDIYWIQIATNLNPPVLWLTLATNAADLSGLVLFVDTNASVYLQCYYRLASPLNTPTVPVILQQPASRTVLAGNNTSFNLMVAGAYPLSLHWYFNTNSPLAYGTNTPLKIPQAASVNVGGYFAIVTNTYGSVTSSIANLTVLPLPQLSIRAASAGIQFSAHGVPGDPYWIQTATNLTPPVVWINVATNLADAGGLILFSDTNSSSGLRRFYRLLAPR